MLLSLFMGKRRWIRVPASHLVQIRGEGCVYTGRLLDISRGGLQLVIEDPLFYEADVDAFACVVQRFPDGAEVRFSEHRIVRHVRIVRATLHKNAWLALGCELDRTLSCGEAVRLGVTAGEMGNGEALDEALPQAPRPGRPVSLLLRVRRRGLSGPYAATPLLAAGERSLDAAIDGTPERVAADLADEEVTGSVLVGRRPLWDGDLRLVRCDVQNGTGNGHRVLMRLMAEAPFGGRLRRHLRPVPAY